MRRPNGPGDPKADELRERDEVRRGRARGTRPRSAGNARPRRASAASARARSDATNASYGCVGPRAPVACACARKARHSAGPALAATTTPRAPGSRRADAELGRAASYAAMRTTRRARCRCPRARANERRRIGAPRSAFRPFDERRRARYGLRAMSGRGMMARCRPIAAAAVVAALAMPAGRAARSAGAPVSRDAGRGASTGDDAGLGARTPTTSSTTRSARRSTRSRTPSTARAPSAGATRARARCASSGCTST